MMMMIVMLMLANILLCNSLSGCPIAAMGKISAVQIKKALSSSGAGLSSFTCEI